jgi:hypothetical protein
MLGQTTELQQAAEQARARAEESLELYKASAVTLQVMMVMVMMVMVMRRTRRRRRRRRRIMVMVMVMVIVRITQRMEGGRRSHLLDRSLVVVRCSHAFRSLGAAYSRLRPNSGPPVRWCRTSWRRRWGR